MMRFLLGVTLVVTSIHSYAKSEETTIIYTQESLQACNKGRSDEIAGLSIGGETRTIVCLEGVDGEYHWVLFSKRRMAYVNSPQLKEKAKKLKDEFEKQLKNLDPEALQRILHDPQEEKSIEGNDVKYET